MSYVNVASGDELYARRMRENGDVVNYADVSLTAIRPGSIVGSMEVSPTAAPVFISGSKLNDRHEVLVFNDASIFLYWSFESAPTIGVDTMPIPSGTVLHFQFDPNDPKDIYLITSEHTTDVKVVELK